jgi:hypothetical protein
MGGQTSKPKVRYCTTNWRDYDRSLIARGDVTVWIDKDIRWLEEPTGQRGRPKYYSDAALQCMLTLKALYRLPLRAAQGMTRSLLHLLGLTWPTPHYSTVSKRQADLTVNIGHRQRNEPLHLLIDSTGLKVMGEGEWKVKKHGPEYRRVWRKLHLAIDAETHEIRAVEMTDHRHGDAEVVSELLSQLPPTAKLAALYGDGAYDTKDCYKVAHACGAALIVPPRRNGRPWQERTTWAEARNEALRAIDRFGRRLWKRWSGYHRRSLVETSMHRYKLLGERLSARKPERQVAEVHVRCTILNTFCWLGMPETVALA